jgi:hypothetical protein
VLLARISRPRKVAGLLVASAALVLSAAACGGGSDSSSSTSGNTPGGGNTALAAYTQCLAKNGVTITMPSGGARQPGGGVRPSGGARPSGFPRPSGSAGAPGGGNFGGGGGFGGDLQKPADVSQDTWDKATAACASVKPSFAAGGNRGGNGGAADAAYRNCMTQHGVTMGQGKVDTTTSAYKTADKTCAVLKPTASSTPTA